MPVQISTTFSSPKRRVIAIAGNPNAGKTTVFNALTGTRQKVGNYPGVTVERKIGQLRLPAGEIVDVVDTPGCYSLAARSPEEQVAHDVLLGELPGEARPDLVVVVVDASNLQRNLFLATQLRDLGIPLIVGLNMMDVARERGMEVSAEKLSTALGCPVVPLVARKGEGMAELIESLELCNCEDCGCGVPRFIDCLPSALEKPVMTLAAGLVDSGFADETTARAHALWLLISTIEGDDAVRISPAQAALTRRVLSELHVSTKQLRAVETSARYRYLKDLMFAAACVDQDLPHRLTDRLDRVLLHRVLGPLTFLGLMAIVFQSIFSWAAPAQDLIEAGVGMFARGADALLPAGLFKALIMDGMIAGVGNILVFLPQILILFLFIGLLEDVGYMARAAFLMDRLMAKVGLDGRAFLPLLSSFACAIPGIMATRTIASRKDRIVTILVAPLMSCSARLPVYALVIGTVFVAGQSVLGIFTVGGLVLMAMYTLSIFAAINMAAIFKKTILKSPPPPLFLELPTYKLPSFRTLGLNLLDRAKLFVVRAGTVILAATVILWAVMNVPAVKTDRAVFDSQRAAVNGNPAIDELTRTAQMAAIDGTEAALLSEHSIGGQCGKLIEPVIEPLGFDWKIGIGIIASFAARELFVSSMAVVHGITDADENSPSLREKLQSEVYPATGRRVFTPLVGVALMVFYVLACQCMSTVAIVRRETASWRWPIFMVIYMSGLAWLVTFAVYQGGKLMGLG
ncbi:ferrous iron transport protein B [candidate division KSB1 bacterium]|nr:ferrous iron transport protein B [candidate division KSB1 bacterium]